MLQGYLIRGVDMKKSDISISNNQNIKVGCRDYVIGDLSLTQTVMLGRFIVKTILSNQDTLKHFQGEIENKEINTDDIMSIWEMFDVKNVCQLFSIILNENDLQFLENNLNLENSIKILVVLCRHNNFESIKEDVQNIIKTITQKGKKITN